MSETHRFTRRQVLLNLGRGAVGVALFTGAAACGRSRGTAAGAGTTEPAVTPGPGSSGSAAGLRWQRADLGMVSAYLLLRRDEAVLVDTGTDDIGVDDIEAALTAAGGRWDGVRHVILTHQHHDHVGGLNEVLRRATGAGIAVGEPDVDAVRAAYNPEGRITAVRDGDEIFGLRIVATPGHTPGHISVLDPESRVLVVGDAMTNEGVLSGANPAYSDDLARAADSVRTLAGMDLDTLLFGHGDPLTKGVDEALDRLLPTLPGSSS